MATIVVIPAKQQQPPSGVKDKNIPDLNWVTSRIALGGEITSKKMAQAIADMGVTAVLNVRTSQDEVPYVQLAGMKYFSNPTQDDNDKYPDKKPPEWFQASSDVIRTQMSGPAQRVFVHCQAGQNRGPSTVYFYLRSLGLDPKLCERMITDARPVAKGNMVYNDDAEAALKKLGYNI